MLIKEIGSKSIFSKSGLADYALKCYVGCRYCYAGFMGWWKANGFPWGEKEETARYSLYEKYFKEDTKKAIHPRRY